MKLYKVILAQFDSDGEVGFESEEVIAESLEEAHEFAYVMPGRIYKIHEIDEADMNQKQLERLNMARIEKELSKYITIKNPAFAR